MTTDDDNSDEWQRWWLTPGFPPTPGPTPAPKGTPGHRLSSSSLYPQPGPFVVYRLLMSTDASVLKTRRLLATLRKAIAARTLMPAAERASELRAELAYHGRQLDAALLRVSADAPAYDDEVAEARTRLDELVVECKPTLALAPNRDEEKDRQAWVLRVDRAEQVRLASEQPATDGGQIIDAAARFAGGATPSRQPAPPTHASAATPGHARSRYRLDRTSYDALVGAPNELGLERLEEAVRAVDHEDAAVRALARVKLGLELPIEHVVRIVAGLAHLDVALALIRHASGNVVAGLVDLLDDGRIPPTREETERRAIVLLALWQLGAKVTSRDTIRRWVRRTLRTERTPLATDVLRWLVHELGDADVDRVARTCAVAPMETPAPVVSEAIRILTAETLADSIAYLPRRALDEPLPGGGVRAAPKVRPNEPCPCGSGKKFKRCHGDGAAVPRAAPAHREHQLGALAGRLTPAQLAKLSQADLARLDLGALSDSTLVEYMRLQIRHHDWHRARAAVGRIVARPSLAAQASAFHDELLMALFRNDRFGVAIAHMESIPASPRAAVPAALLTAMADGSADALPLLRRAAREAVADPSGARTAALAHMLLAYDRSLGILVARGAMRADQPDRSQLLTDRIEEARDDLLLPPRDPAAESRAHLALLEADCLEHRSERERVEGMLEAARAELDVRAARIAELEREVTRHAAEKHTSAQPTASRHVHAGHRIRSLRDKVDELEALVREKNEQLAALRREVAAPAASPGPANGTAVPPVADDDDAPAIGDGASRDVLVIRYNARAASALSAIPRHVAAQATRMIGMLAAGDTAAWSGVKQAKGMPRQVLMARVGIHHRLLSRVDDGALEVLDLVTREDLQTTLKRMRER